MGLPTLVMLRQAEVRMHMEEWIALTPPEHMARTLHVATAWLRDRLHLDLYRMQLLEVGRR
jgi:hypothetical protein